MEKTEFKKIKIRKKLFNGKNFYPELQKIKWENNQIIDSVDKFVLVPKNLFDLLYKTIEKNDFSKEDFKYKTLIGDGAIFLQNKENEGQFAIYKYDDSQFKLNYSV